MFTPEPQLARIGSEGAAASPAGFHRALQILATVGVNVYRPN